MSSLVLQDLTARARLGVCGADLNRWLDANGYTISSESNVASRQADGSLIVRLSPGELVWLGGATQSLDELVSIEEDFRCYCVSRRDSYTWFRIDGESAPSMFAKLCGVDLSPEAFPDCAIAQTSVARTSAIIVRHDTDYTPRFHLLGDSSTRQYMWSCLVDAMQEYAGTVSLEQSI